MSTSAEKWQENPMWEGRCLKCGGETESFLGTDILICQRCWRAFIPDADDGDKEIITARVGARDI
jgi:DNA-directed RNA polymerase subunit RPC12/RpoP